MATATVTAWRVVMATDGGAIRIMPVKTQAQGEECAESVVGTETARGVIVSASVEQSNGDGWQVVHYTEY